MAYYRYYMIEDVMLDNTAFGNEEIATIYKKEIWDKQQRVITKLNNSSFVDLLGDAEFIEFARQSLALFNNLELGKVTFYNKFGQAFLSTNDTKIEPISEHPTGSIYQKFVLFLDLYFMHDKTSEGALDKSLQGKIQHTILPVAQVTSDDSSGDDYANYIKSYIPLINNNNYEIEGVIEIAVNSTQQWDRIAFLEGQAFVVFFVIFTFFFAVVLYNTHHAQKIIDSQYEKNIQLKEAKLRAEAESSEKTEFLANMSHELRTPLNAIIGFSEIILQQAYGPLEEKYHNYITDIHNSGKHLLSIINDILDFQKAAANKLTIDSVDVDLSKICSSSMRFVQPRADGAGVILVIDKPQEHIVIKADPKRLKQALLNLLSNSVKFTPAGGSVTIKVEPDYPNQKAIVRVIDTGIGIEEKNIPKALSSFGQIDNKHSRKYTGTGLGLPLTKKLVELMNGTFEIRSKLGTGTTITLTFDLSTDFEL